MTPTQPTSADALREAWRRNLRGSADDAALAGPRPDAWWTGVRPGTAPLRGLPLPDLATCTRASIAAYFENGWTLTETLFSALQGEEAFYRPPWHSLRHPMVFYYAHPAVLFVNKMRIAGLVAGPVDAAYEQLFETGVDEMSWDDLSKNDMEWPRVADVTEYRRRVHRLVLDVISTHPGLAPGHAVITETSPLWAVLMGMEHERIHLETSSVLIRELPAHLVARPAAWPPEFPATDGAAPPANPWIAVPAGDAVVGKSRDVPTYHWDNEVGARRIAVPAFDVTARLVSNAEFREFVVAGGYADPRWWPEDGWKWRTFRNAKHPTFWVPDGPAGLHAYRLRRIFDVVPFQGDLPAIVNHHEASAYARWRTALDGAPDAYRLLSEAEHHRIRGASEPGVQSNTALAFGSECAVDAMPANSLGFHDVFGNVWQWCEDHIAALPGFRVHPLYDDFTTPCFDGEHNVILGGSFVSLGDEASPYARFHFRRHFHQHAGFRLVRPAPDAPRPETTCMDSPPPHVGNGPCCSRDAARAPRSASGYESRAMLDAYLMLHFATADETFGAGPGPRDAACFPRRCGELTRAWADRIGAGDGRALDVGCAVGGAAFDLARRFREVVGIDLSASFVDAANAVRASGRAEFLRVDEGALTTPLAAEVDPSIDRTRTTFRRGDAGSLPADLGAFDAVLVANLLCRLPSPKALLGRLGGPRGLVRPGGVLVITTPSTWREEFTPRDAWLGGFERGGRRVTTLDGLHAELDAEFELLEAADMPFVLREHARKFEYVVAQSSVWRRRG
ncbi:MAG: 5-histidylcysteine sulfoxide synthase [Planctomycetes bacterium]|nr:5-histidylcysteine sulfoxide synthase [Planctomycetota bacterium]